MVEIDVRVTHSASSATLRFTTDITEDNDWWGLNDVYVEAVADQPSAPSPPSPPGSWSEVLHDVWPGATGWTGSITIDASAITTCGDLGTQLGGYQQLGASDYVEKTIVTLPAHNKLRVSARLFKIDQWSNNRLQFQVDGNDAWESNAYTSHGDYECGDSGYNQKDLMIDMEVTVAHVASSVTLRFTTDISAADMWWGINDVVVHVVS